VFCTVKHFLELSSAPYWYSWRQNVDAIFLVFMVKHLQAYKSCVGKAQPLQRNYVRINFRPPQTRRRFKWDGCMQLWQTANTPGIIITLRVRSRLPFDEQSEAETEHLSRAQDVWNWRSRPDLSPSYRLIDISSPFNIWCLITLNLPPPLHPQIQTPFFSLFPQLFRFLSLSFNVIASLSLFRRFCPVASTLFSTFVVNKLGVLCVV
jgi:hypothetical protein